MSTTLTQQPTAVDAENFAVPAELDSPQSKLVYLFLTVEGEATIDEITDSLGVKKISLYPTLSGLAKQGFVRQDGETYSFDHN